MAGSFQHVLEQRDDHTDLAHGNYIGTDLLENMGDMAEAVEHMAFMLLYVRDVIVPEEYGKSGGAILQAADDAYYACCRGEQEWPDFMKEHG